MSEYEHQVLKEIESPSPSLESVSLRLMCIGSMQLKECLKRERSNVSSHKTRLSPLLAYSQTELQYRKTLDIFCQHLRIKGAPVSQDVLKITYWRRVLTQLKKIKNKEEKVSLQKKCVLRSDHNFFHILIHERLIYISKCNYWTTVIPFLKLLKR